MTDELSQAAERAWVAMLHDVRPMPAGVALDMAQDVCGDRDDAVTALLNAAADELESLLPAGGPFHPEAGFIVSHVRAEDFKFAETLLKNVRGRAGNMHRVSAHLADSTAGAAWLRWCAYAERDIALCRAVCAAAYPLEV